MRPGLRAALFVSAFAPSLISVGVARILSKGLDWDALYYIFGGMFACLVIFYILHALKWYGEVFGFRAKKVEPHDALLLGAIVTYIVPFYVKSADITIGIIAGILTAAWIFFWFTGSIMPSPLMRLLSFRFYKVESENGMVYTLLTNREILDPRDVKTVKKISNTMLLEVVE